MRMRAGLLPLFVLPVFAGGIFAQSTETRLEKLEQRMNQYEKKNSEHV